jgi:hypothetical protein
LSLQWGAEPQHHHREWNGQKNDNFGELFKAFKQSLCLRSGAFAHHNLPAANRTLETFLAM